MSDKIDFENIKWGSFTKQFKAYRSQYPKSKVKDLDAFAKMVLRNPKKFQPRTQKRASFYLNVILPQQSARSGGVVGDSDDEGETDHEDNSDDEEEGEPNLALPHFWDGHQWVLMPPQPVNPNLDDWGLLADDEILEGEGYRKMYQSALHGGKLSISSLKGLLNKSYDKKPENYLEYELDKELSGQRVQVYKNKKTGEVVVSHRGTQGIHDIGTDLKYALGFDLKNTERYKHAEDIQRKAEAKYGAKNITTIGHSLGSKLARDVGQNSKEVIELNPAYNIPDALKKKSDNTYSIRTKYDPVSFLVPFFKKDKNTTTLESKTLNPLAEHTVNVLDRADQDKEIGAGLKKKSLRELKALAKKLPKQHRIKLTKLKKGDLLSHLCSCGGSL
jgi:hypothetical protein